MGLRAGHLRLHMKAVKATLVVSPVTHQLQRRSQVLSQHALLCAPDRHRLDTPFKYCSSNPALSAPALHPPTCELERREAVGQRAFVPVGIPNRVHIHLSHVHPCIQHGLDDAEGRFFRGPVQARLASAMGRRQLCQEKDQKEQRDTWVDIPALPS